MSLKRNVVINIFGSLFPLAIAIVTVPLYLKEVGTARYGVLALVWLFAGYFSLLDFGISRATVNQISKIENKDEKLQQKIFWSAIWLNVFIGLSGMVTAYPLANYAFSVIHFDDVEIRNELIAAIPWLCMTVPLTVVSAVGLGGLEARERFDIANVIQIFGALITQVSPVLVAYKFGPRLDFLILTIVMARIISFVLLFVSLKHAFPLKKPVKWDSKIIRQLLTYGSWASVSGIISPILDALDRFVIGAKLGATDVALYTIPFSIADKLRIIPRALGRAAFPKLSGLTELDAYKLYNDLIMGSMRLMTPIVLVLIFCADRLLTLWIGLEHAAQSSTIAIILMCGAWFNSIAFIPFVYVQAKGRPNVTATLHMIEFLPFVAALFTAVHYWGGVGAAMAWSGRMLVDCVLLSHFANADKRVNRWLIINGSTLVIAALAAIFHKLSILELALALTLVGGSFLMLNHAMIGTLLRKKR